MNPQQYCEDLVAKPGSNVYYSLMYCQPKVRQALVALHALQHQLTNIPRRSKEPSVLGAQFAWWRSELAQCEHGSPQHPISLAIQTTLKSFPLPMTLFEEWIQGQQLKQQSNHCCSERDFEFYAYREYGIFFILASMVLAHPHEAKLDFAHQLATVIARSQLMTHLRQQVLCDEVFFPLDSLEKHGLDPSHFHLLTLSEAMQDFLSEQYALIKQQWQQTMARMSKKEKKIQLPLVLYGKLIIKQLQLLADEQFPVFDKQLELTPTYRWWLCWRGRWGGVR